MFKGTEVLKKRWFYEIGMFVTVTTKARLCNSSRERQNVRTRRSSAIVFDKYWWWCWWWWWWNVY